MELACLESSIMESETWVRIWRYLLTPVPTVDVRDIQNGIEFVKRMDSVKIMLAPATAAASREVRRRKRRLSTAVDGAAAASADAAGSASKTIVTTVTPFIEFMDGFSLVLPGKKDNGVVKSVPFAVVENFGRSLSQALWEDCMEESRRDSGYSYPSVRTRATKGRNRRSSLCGNVSVVPKLGHIKLCTY